MVIVTPSRLPPSTEDPEALFQEARERQRRRRLRIALLALLIVGGAGSGFLVNEVVSGGRSAATCTTSTCAVAGAHATRLANPCTLLTTADVAQAIGVKVTGHTLTANSLAGLCTWHGPTYHGGLGAPTRPGLMLSIFKESKARFDYYSHKQAQGITKKQSQEAVTVPGVGTEAFYYPGGVGVLRVWKAGTVLTLHGVLVVLSETQLATLGRSAVAHL